MSDRDRFASPNPQHTFLLQPDSFLPVQRFDSLYRLTTPEKRLMVAVLTDAVYTFQKLCFAPSRRGRRVSSEAEKWFMSIDRSWPFSFENICDILNLDAQGLRSGLQRWREQQRGVLDQPQATNTASDARPIKMRAA